MKRRWKTLKNGERREERVNGIDYERLQGLARM